MADLGRIIGRNPVTGPQQDTGTDSYVRTAELAYGSPEWKAYQERNNLANQQRFQGVKSGYAEAYYAAEVNRQRAEEERRRREIEANKKEWWQKIPGVEPFVDVHVALFEEVKAGMEGITGIDFGKLEKYGNQAANIFKGNSAPKVPAITMQDYSPDYSGISARRPDNSELRAAQARVTATAGGLTRNATNEYAKTETRLRELMPKGNARENVGKGEYYNEL